MGHAVPSGAALFPCFLGGSVCFRFNPSLLFVHSLFPPLRFISHKTAPSVLSTSSNIESSPDPSGPAVIPEGQFCWNFFLFLPGWSRGNGVPCFPCTQCHVPPAASQEVSSVYPLALPLDSPFSPSRWPPSSPASERPHVL